MKSEDISTYFWNTSSTKSENPSTFYLRNKYHSVLDLNCVIILPNAGAISTSTEFLYIQIVKKVTAVPEALRS